VMAVTFLSVMRSRSRSCESLEAHLGSCLGLVSDNLANVLSHLGLDEAQGLSLFLVSELVVSVLVSELKVSRVSKNNIWNLKNKNKKQTSASLHFAIKINFKRM